MLNILAITNEDKIRASIAAIGALPPVQCLESAVYVQVRFDLGQLLNRIEDFYGLLQTDETAARIKRTSRTFGVSLVLQS